MNPAGAFYSIEKGFHHEPFTYLEIHPTLCFNLVPSCILLSTQGEKGGWIARVQAKAGYVRPLRGGGGDKNARNA